VDRKYNKNIMNKTCELKKLIKDIVKEVLKEIKEEEDKKLIEEMDKSYGGTD
tara:strand:+ start:12 stop:167 length:156 start_codon:yes stop_codon:yes gene_type:complete